MTCLSPDMLNEAPTRKSGISEANVKQLTDMGFPENRAKKALLLNQCVAQLLIYINSFQYTQIYYFNFCIIFFVETPIMNLMFINIQFIINEKNS